MRSSTPIDPPFVALRAWVRSSAKSVLLTAGASALVAGTLVLGSAPPTGAQGPVAFSFVTNFGGNSVTEYAQEANGDATPVATISGSSTGLDAPAGVVLDSSGNLLVANAFANSQNGSVTEFAKGANGNVAPPVTIQGSSTGLATPFGVALDSSGNLFVANAGNSVTEYASGASGDVAPIATIEGSSTGLDGPLGVSLDSSGNVFVANEVGNSVTEYAKGANGNVAPEATIEGSSTGLNAPGGVVLDSPGNVFVANEGNTSVTEYAPGASGNVTPEATIRGSSTGLNGPNGMVLDASANLFVANEFGGSSGLGSVTEYAKGANGNVAPEASIAGSSTGLDEPFGVAVAPVSSPSAQLAALDELVQGVGAGTSLADKVAQAQSELAAGDMADTCGTLGAFTHEVNAQSGKIATANQLIAEVQGIQTELGC